MTRILTILFLLVLLLLALSFSLINAHQVTLSYYVGELNLPLSFVVIAALVVGALAGAVVMMRPVFSLRLEIARLRKTVKTTEKEITNLRSIPAKEP